MDLAKHNHSDANVSRVNMINLKLLQCWDDPWPSKDQVGQWYKYRREKNLKSEYHLAGTSKFNLKPSIREKNISVVEAFENW